MNKRLMFLRRVIASTIKGGFCLYRGSDIAHAAEAFAINKEAIYA